MSLSQKYKEYKMETVKDEFDGEEIELKLFVQSEAEELEGKPLKDLLAASVVEDGKTLAEQGLQDIFDNMSGARQKQLFELITKVNGGVGSIEEKKSN